MASADYPEGMTEELARELYGSVKVKWASEPFVFDPERSECQEWLDRGARTLDLSYEFGYWPRLVNVIRRYDKTGIRVFQYSDGSVFEQEQ